MARQREATERREKDEVPKKDDAPKKEVLKKDEAVTAEDLRNQFFSEFQEMQNVQGRVAFLRERHPHLFSRLAMLGNLVTIQQNSGGEFPPKMAFVHMADYVLNVHRVGRVDIDALVVALEVYEHNDIVPGIVWLPLDQIWWVGTTDLPVDEQHVSLTNKAGSSVTPPTRYGEIRRKIAGLDSSPRQG